MNIRIKSVENVRALVAEPSAEHLRLLRADDYVGREVTAADVRVREMLLCHDQIDRTFEKFPKPYLSRFMETLPGKSVLPGHNKEELPLGRFFTATLDRRRESFPVLLQPGREEEDERGAEDEAVKAEVVPGFATRQRWVTYLKSGFYYPNDADAAGLDNRIRLGVYRSVSIGFRYDDLTCDVCQKSYLGGDCPHLLGQREEDGRFITGTYSGDAEKAEALEGSIVFLGTQPNARLVKSMVREGAVDPDRLAWTEYGEDGVALKEAEGLARKYGHARKVWAAKKDAEVAEPDAADPEISSLDGEAPEAAEAPPATSLDGDAEGDQDAARGGASEDDKMLEKMLKALGLPETATEEDALKAAEAAKKDADAAPAIASARDDLKTKLDAASPFATIGEKALSDLAARYLEYCGKLGDSDADLVEKKALADAWVQARDYDRLKSMVELKWAAVCEKFPAGTSGRPGQIEETRRPEAGPHSRRLASLVP